MIESERPLCRTAFFYHCSPIRRDTANLAGYPHVALTGAQVNTNPAPIMRVFRVFQTGGVQAMNALFFSHAVAHCILTDGLHIGPDLFKHLSSRFVPKSHRKSAISTRWRFRVRRSPRVDFIIRPEWIPLVQLMDFAPVLARNGKLA